jgi:hypothetical protein
MAINCKCCPGEVAHQGEAWRAEVYEGLAADLWPIASDEKCRAYIRYRNLSLWFVANGRDKKVWQGWNR